MNNAAFSQPSLIIFTKGANIFGHECSHWLTEASVCSQPPVTVCVASYRFFLLLLLYGINIFVFKRCISPNVDFSFLIKVDAHLYIAKYLPKSSTNSRSVWV